MGSGLPHPQHKLLSPFLEMRGLVIPCFLEFGVFLDPLLRCSGGANVPLCFGCVGRGERGYALALML